MIAPWNIRFILGFLHRCWLIKPWFPTRWCLPSYKLVIIPITSSIYHLSTIVIGLMFTNLANHGAPPRKDPGTPTSLPASSKSLYFAPKFTKSECCGPLWRCDARWEVSEMRGRRKSGGELQKIIQASRPLWYWKPWFWGFQVMDDHDFVLKQPRWPWWRLRITHSMKASYIGMGFLSWTTNLNLIKSNQHNSVQIWEISLDSGLFPCKNGGFPKMVVPQNGCF